MMLTGNWRSSAVGFLGMQKMLALNKYKGLIFKNAAL